MPSDSTSSRFWPTMVMVSVSRALPSSSATTVTCGRAHASARLSQAGRQQPQRLGRTHQCGRLVVHDLRQLTLQGLVLRGHHLGQLELGASQLVLRGKRSGSMRQRVRQQLDGCDLRRSLGPHVPRPGPSQCPPPAGMREAVLQKLTTRSSAKQLAAGRIFLSVFVLCGRS